MVPDGGGPVKTVAPIRSSIYKTSGDLFLVGNTVTMQPFERLAVRDGNLIIYGDSSLTLSNVAASRGLALIAPLVQIRSRAPQSVVIPGATAMTLRNDRGTDIVAGRVVFFNTSLAGAPTRAGLGAFATTSLGVSRGNVSVNGSGFLTVLPQGGATSAGPADVFVADLTNTFSVYRPSATNVVYLDLATSPDFPSLSNPRPSAFGTDRFGAASYSVMAGGDQRESTSISIDQETTSTVVRETSFLPMVIKEFEFLPEGEVELSNTVREQLAALGIYARAMFPSELASRYKKTGLFTVVPNRVRPLDEDYKVVDARVEEGCVREAPRLAAESRLIGEGSNKLAPVAESLAASYQAFAAETGTEDAIRFRAWLDQRQDKNADTLKAFAKSVRATLREIKLLGLTKQEIDVSESYIFGNILVPALNVDGAFLRAFLEPQSSLASLPGGSSSSPVL